jgi:hypothetical protein
MKNKIGIVIGLLGVVISIIVGAYTHFRNPEGVTFYPGYPESPASSFILGFGLSLLYINCINIAALLVVPVVELFRAKKTLVITRNIFFANIVVFGFSMCAYMWLIL